MRSFRYFITEGIKNIFLHGFMSFSAVGIIAACFAVTGCFTILALDVDRIARGLESKSEISVFIDEKLSEDEAKRVQESILNIEHVQNAEFVSKDQALKDYKDSLGEEGNFLEGLESDNPLRHSYKIQLDDLQYHEEVISALGGIKEIVSISDKKDISSKLVMVRTLVHAVSFTLIAMLGGVSIFIISNTVKLATFARREEIAIMKMVGATDGFVRWPFIIEGLILGETGACLSYFLQYAFCIFIEDLILNGVSFIDIYTFSELSSNLFITVLAAGAVVGVGGSVLAIRRFLKV